MSADREWERAEEDRQHAQLVEEERERVARHAPVEATLVEEKPHVCTCGDCQPDAFVDVCRFEAMARDLAGALNVIMVRVRQGQAFVAGDQMTAYEALRKHPEFASEHVKQLLAAEGSEA